MSAEMTTSCRRSDPLISVIIPTYNRCESLLVTLKSLALQAYRADGFEVIVVDDGSSDDTSDVARVSFAFDLRYLRQENRGGVEARNRGAELARGDMLVFLDDDMTASPAYLACLARALCNERRSLARGRLAPWEDGSSVFARYQASLLSASHSEIGAFTSNNLAVSHADFFSLGGWFDLLGTAAEHRGGIWSDLEFAVRARQEGYRLVTVETAEVVHRDYAARTLMSACKRAYMVSRLAARVVHTHPHLWPDLPMVHDKAHVRWQQDGMALILRKLTRQVVSSRPVMSAMEGAVPWLEHRYPDSVGLRLVYRWIVSGYIYRGYRQGLREIGQCCGR